MKLNDNYADKLAHDISNILQTILISTELCLNSLDDKISVGEKLKNIKNEVLRAANLIGKIREAMSEGMTIG